jgi:hypothetical protein
MTISETERPPPAAGTVQERGESGIRFKGDQKMWKGSHQGAARKGQMRQPRVWVFKPDSFRQARLKAEGN